MKEKSLKRRDEMISRNRILVYRAIAFLILRRLIQLRYLQAIQNLNEIYLLDMPHGFEWKGVFIDANLRAVSVIPTLTKGGEGGFSSDRQKTFMQLSALQGSILENRIFEDDLQVDSISTAKLMQIVGANGGSPILTIDKTNISAVLSASDLADNIKEDITNAVNQGLVVRIPSANSLLLNAISYKDWTGIGYVKENPSTGEAGYMLSGMIAGGVSVITPEKWANQYLMQILKGQYAGQFNKDPLAAAKIIKIPVTDGHEGTVGQPLAQPFAVLVTDKKGVPVLGAKVNFTVDAGSGNFGTDAGGQQISVSESTTGKDGIAKSKPLILGKKTSDNPTEYWKTGYTYYQQVGLNLVDASLASGISISSPFTAYGFPDDPKSIKKLHGDGETPGAILSFKGFVSLIIEDQYENPIANLPITFQALAAQANNDPPNCADRYIDTLRGTLLTKAGDPCIKNAPIYGECPDAKPVLSGVTDNRGASAQVILGGTPDAIYPITATCTHPKCANMSVTFNLYTHYHDDCNDHAPKAQLFATYVYDADRYGNNINAGKTGTVIPVQARLKYLKENSKEANETLSCESGAITCKKIVGDRSYSAGSDFASSSATFAGVAGTSKGNGIFSSTYTLAPGLNNVQIKGNGTITDKRSYNSCSGCSINDSATINLNESMTTMKVYGVDITVDSPPLILVDENGLAQDNYDITYAITPAEYRAATAYMFINKEGDPNPWWFMANALQGTGKATIDKGFPFDINSKYEAEIVLNYGTGVEIRSGRVPLKLEKDYIEVTLGLTKQLRVDPDPVNLGLLKITAGNPSAMTLDWGLNERNIKYYDNGRIEGNGLFRVIHFNKEFCDCSVTVSDGSRVGTEKTVVRRPQRLGETNNQYDELIIDAAERYGVPPQLIKAMIRQESNFNPNTGRYEPFFDVIYVQNNFASSPYWLTTGQTTYDYYTTHRASYPQRLWPSNIRREYNRLLSSQGVSVAETYLRNYLNYGRRDGSNPPEGTQSFIAQTRIATSYGLLQVMYPTALRRGFPNNRPPEDLRDPYISIDFGVGYLRRQFNRVGDTGNWDADWDNALLRYNGGGNPSYPGDVRRWVNDYLPQPVY